jgi:hypothetical protein
MIVGKATVLQKSGLTTLLAPYLREGGAKATATHLPGQCHPIGPGLEGRINQDLINADRFKIASDPHRSLAASAVVLHEVPGVAFVVEQAPSAQSFDKLLDEAPIKATLAQLGGELAAGEIAARQECNGSQFGG